MSTDVDICNTALAYLGDDATVSSIDPPEGSRQAENCARFYPMARDSMLEKYDWNFATKRITPAAITSTITQWAYAYQGPSDMLKVVALLPYGSTDDYSAPPAVYPDNYYSTPVQDIQQYQPQPYKLEALSDGTVVIYTNIENPVLIYVFRCLDASKFPPLFADALAWNLASRLAGPLLKGDVGRKESKECLKMFQFVWADATASDANQAKTNIQQSVNSMNARK